MLGDFFMFLVFNKEKIYAYIVSILTVIVLFFTAGALNKQDVIETSSTVEKRLPIYNVNIEENKIAFTINCAWNADDIDRILEVLKENDVHITFFIVGDWMDKYPDAVKKIYEAGHEIRNT